MNCGCKGIRTCLYCENEKADVLETRSKSVYSAAIDEYSYCYHCKCAWKDGDAYTIAEKHPNHTGESLRIDGIDIIPDFVTKSEQDYLVESIDSITWVSSQSGRRKQDFGPKVNFKKQKVKIGSFCGFPSFVSFLLNRLRTVPVLSNFVPVELCNLEYISERGSSIDSHLDDTWLWGEHLVTINLVSDTILSLSPVLLANNKTDIESIKENKQDIHHQCLVHVPLYSCSLIVLYGEARYNWYHAIFRKNVTSRRLAMTLRELSAEFSLGGAEESIGKKILERIGCYTANT